MGIFSVRTSQSETGFRFFRVRIDGRSTTVSIDPVLAEQLEAILGSSKSTRAWINDVANRIDAVMSANTEKGTKVAGLSRLVSREGWRFVLDPDHGHICDLDKLGRCHPLKQRLDG